MVVLTCTIIGLFATIPWAYLSCLFLVIGILWKGKPMLYPDNIKWAPVTETDTTIAWVIVAITVIGIIAGFFIGTREGFQYNKEIEDDED
jgi:amino acid transporter